MEAKSHSRVGAVILAAGMSSRMGEAKQLLRLGECTLFEQVLDSVRGSRVEEIVVVLGHEAETIQERVALQDFKVVINHAYREGMGTSLRAGIAALSAAVGATLIVLADQPFVRPGTLDQIITVYLQSGGRIVIPTYKGFRGNPVLLDRSVFPQVMALGGDIGCRAIFGDNSDGIVKAAVGDVGVLLDLDTKTDFERLRGFGDDAGDDTRLMEVADLRGRQSGGPVAPSQGQELVIVGRDPFAIALARLGRILHLAVTIVDPFLTSSAVPDADRVLNSLDFSLLPTAAAQYVVVASRGQFDEEAVEQALHANSTYVALIANKKRGQEILRSLELRGAAAEQLAKVHVPAGIDIGAESAEEIALSVMAEIIAESKKNRSRVSRD